MNFEEILDQAIAMLQRRGRLTYRTLKQQFALDDVALAALREELIYGQRLAVDEADKVLVWSENPAPAAPTAQEPSLAVALQPLDAERRHLTVLFCNLVDSTVLASQLDPEELREVVWAYQETCAKVIARFDGHIAQYLSDGLLVYFGYPLAHEDDAQRAVRAGLGMVEAVRQLHTRLRCEQEVRLAVRLGIHTGLVVVGEVGSGARQEQLALGDTPNLAARLQGIAAPNTLVISAATLQLLGGFFACESLGACLFKGLAQALQSYRVLYESTARSRLDVTGSTGLTPLVGREQEVELLLERWAQVKDGRGQVVLLSGEAGIGKSRLVQVLKEHVASDPQAWLTPCQCSPYHQHTALYPMIDLLERVVLRFDRQESPQQKLRKLEGHLLQYGLPLAEAMPLFAPLLSIPLSADYAPLSLSPEQQKQKTLHTFLSIFLRIAAQHPVLFVVEDLHWSDPSTLELLSLIVDQGPTARILALWTFRPDFIPLWTGRSHLTQVMLPRLMPRQAVEMTRRVAYDKELPPEVVEQVVAKTDGVPLFVEELTKMVLESGLLQERQECYELTGPLPPLAIPATLHDSLMARLDRLATVKGIVQLGAALGREFAYELLQAVSPWDEETLQRGLQQLVQAELLYQRGLLPQATYVFKHVLIQETAYQSLLQSTRQRYHQRLAQVLERQFPDLCETQPELLAHHYTEAGMMAPAIPYWQRAGQHALEHSAHLEAIAHLSKGVELLRILPDTPERTRQEIHLQMLLGPALMSTQGYAALDVERAYARAHELCQQIGEIPEIFPVLFGLWRFYVVRGALQTAYELARQLLSMAQHQNDSLLLTGAHWALGATSFFLGVLAPARTYLEQGMTLYDPQSHRSLTLLYAVDPGIVCRVYASWVLWLLGYPEQALQKTHEALQLARQLGHPYSQAWALCYAATLARFRQDAAAAQDWAAAAIVLSTEQGFPLFLALGTILQGWTQCVQGQFETGLVQIQQGVSALSSMRVEIFLPCFFSILAEAYGKAGQIAEGLGVLATASTLVDNDGIRWWEAELYRLRGELLLQQAPQHERSQAEASFQQAIDTARRQGAKSLELRAALALSQLWQEQGKRGEARQLLADIYGWFTEGFDTADLCQAKGRLEALS